MTLKCLTHASPQTGISRNLLCRIALQRDRDSLCSAFQTRKIEKYRLMFKQKKTKPLMKNVLPREKRQ